MHRRTLSNISWSLTGDIPLTRLQKGGKSFLSKCLIGAGMAMEGSSGSSMASLIISRSLAASSSSLILPP